MTIPQALEFINYVAFLHIVIIIIIITLFGNYWSKRAKSKFRKFRFFDIKFKRRKFPSARCALEAVAIDSGTDILTARSVSVNTINVLKPAGHVMHHQFNLQQLYALPSLYLCVLYLSENKQRLVPLTA